MRRRWPIEALCALVVGVGLGLASGLGPPWLPVAVLVAAPVPFVLLARPELALLVVLGGYGTVVNSNAIPYFRLGDVSLNLLDLLFLLLLGWIVVKRLLVRGFEVRVTAVGVAIACFLLVAVASTVQGLADGTTTLYSATKELRYFGYYGVYFVVVHLVSSPRRLRFLLAGSLALAVMTSLAMVAQFLVGPGVPIVAGRVDTFAQFGNRVADVARVLPPGRYLVLVAFIAMTVSLGLRGASLRRPWRWIAWTVLGAALLLTFNRNFWLSSGFALVVLAAVFGPAERRRLTRLFAVAAAAVVVLAVSSLVLAPHGRAADLVRSTAERATSLVRGSTYASATQPDLATSSVQFRKIETIYALQRLSPPSLLGLGLGATYRPWLRSLDWNQYDGRGYIHDGHLWVLLKTGVLGYLALLAAMILVVRRGLGVWRRAPPELRPAVLGGALAILAVLISSFVDPIITELNWTPLFGVLAGAIDVVAGWLAVRRPAGAAAIGPRALGGPLGSGDHGGPYPSPHP